jgi:[ribosomal protein S18]-alanine N-acetyltransferase
LSLRPAQPDEAAVLAAMSRRLIETGLAWRYTPRRMRVLMADAETLVLVAHDGRHVQAFAAMEFGDGPAHLLLLCVQPALQRRGLGRRMLEWLLKSARVAGITHVSVEMRADNAAALAFYAALGFVARGRVAGYYEGRVDAVRMQLTLG